MSKLNATLMLAGVLIGSAGYAQPGPIPAPEPPKPAAPSGATMNNEAMRAERDRIKSAYKADKEGCKSQQDNAKDVCEAEAKAKERVALAELRYKASGSPRDHAMVEETKAKTEYDVAKERCDDKAGDARSQCKKEAKAAEKAAIANARKTLAGGG